MKPSCINESPCVMVLAFYIASADVIMLGIANQHNQAPIVPEGLYFSPFNSQDEDCVALFFTAFYYKLPALTVLARSNMRVRSLPATSVSKRANQLTDWWRIGIAAE